MYCIMIKDVNYKWHPITSGAIRYNGKIIPLNVLFLTEDEAEFYAEKYMKRNPQIKEYFVAVNKSQFNLKEIFD